MGRALRQYKETRVLDTEEAAQFRAACTALTGILCPFIADCFSKIYPSSGKQLSFEGLATMLDTPAPPAQTLTIGDRGGSVSVVEKIPEGEAQEA